MRLKAKQFSIFDVQGYRYKASSIEEYKQESQRLSFVVFNGNKLLEQELICSYPYYKQMLSWIELISNKEIDVSDILAKGNYSKKERAAKKISIVAFAKLLSNYLQFPTNDKAEELVKRFNLINLRKDNLVKLKNGILLGRIQCPVSLREKVSKLNDAIESACGKITCLYMPYAINLANCRGIRFDENGEPIGRYVDDYVQAAMLGIYEAAKHFDPTKNISFTTYAWYWISHKFSEVIEKEEVISVPRNIKLLKNKIGKTYQLDNFSNTKQISETLSATETSVQRALEYKKIISIERPGVLNDEGEEEAIDIKDGFKMENFVNQKMQGEKLISVIKQVLSEKEQYIIFLRFGLEGNEQHSYTEIAKKIKMTTEGARQAIKKAIQKMIPIIVNTFGEDYGEQDTKKVLALHCKEK